jgi:hypothetical protein
LARSGSVSVLFFGLVKRATKTKGHNVCVFRFDGWSCGMLLGLYVSLAFEPRRFALLATMQPKAAFLYQLEASFLIPEHIRPQQ